jgi:dipeptidyl aminopeptidase/acylaminoacyl peptidase
VYIPRTNGTSAVQRSLVWVDRKGKEEPISAPTNAYSNLKLSPDGTRVALTFETSGNQDIWIWHLVHKIMMRLTSDEAPDRIPLWSPDGERIVFASHREGNYGVQWKAADGTGEVENLGSVPARLIIPNCWSHDGKMLFLTEWDNIPPRFDISVLSMEGDHARTILLQGKHSEAQPRISPNGRWLAYVSDESGRNEVYVRPFPEVDKGRWQISTNNGDSPLWSPDGHELFYRSGDAAMAVPVETEPTFRFAAPKILFSGAYASYAARVYGQIENNPWDISPDGKRFLMMKPVAAKGTESTAEGPRRINIVLNWLEELKQRVPVP